MNRQEIFDTAANGIIAQGGPAYRDGACMYYDETNERRCAIGLCFSYSEARSLEERFRGMSVEEIYRCELFQSKFGDLSIEDVDFLNSLQDAHDSPNYSPHVAGTVGDIQESLKDFARTYGLSIDNVNWIEDEGLNEDRN